MNATCGNFEKIIAAVRALSEHRQRRISVKGRPLPVEKPKPRTDGPLDMALAVRLGWCSAPIKMQPTTDSDYARYHRKNAV